MDTGTADTINRQDARKVASHLDLTDWFSGRVQTGKPWFLGLEAQVFLSKTASTGEQAWLFGFLAARVSDLHFDGAPADCDWDALLSYMRAEILARRDPKSPLVHAAEIPVRDGVGSR